MRTIEITSEKVRIGRETYHKGDRRAFEDDQAAEYIRLGWAKDPETGEEGERTPGAQRLKVDPIVQPAS